MVGLKDHQQQGPGSAATRISSNREGGQDAVSLAPDFDGTHIPSLKVHSLKVCM